MSRSDLEIQALLRQWRAVMSASRPRWGDLDLTLTQLRALSLLAELQPVRVSDLAQALHVSLASASALTDRLVRLGFVLRRSDPADRRGVLLHLDPRGSRLLARLERGSTRQMSAVIEQMNADERAALGMVLRAFVRVSGSGGPAAKPQRAARDRSSAATVAR